MALSLVVGTFLLGIKFYAYRRTGSSAVLSDAMESIVNVVAAGAALAGLAFAARPADSNHPYGHGKVEYLTAAFEGGLIAFAAVLIIGQAIAALVRGDASHELGWGIALTTLAGVVNALLGWFLVQRGRQLDSLALVADGRHLLADFWTSLGVVVGLALVVLTGQPWIDPAVAIAVGAHLIFSGWCVVREAFRGLLDEEDPELLGEIVAAMNESPLPGVIRVHFLRAIRSARFRHVDAHLVVPEFWSVDRAHDLGEALEKQISANLPGDTEIAFHIDPCERAYCSACDVADCPIRREAFVTRPPIDLAEATSRLPV